MEIALTTETPLACHTDAGYTVPFAALELSEHPDSGPHHGRAESQGDTIVQAIEGVVYVVAGEDEWVLSPGDAAMVPAGTPYRSWNAGEDDARWVELYCSA